jgi:hypothetical protein
LRVVREILIVRHVMRILVQNSLRKAYFDGFAWNANMAKAKAFASVAQAESFCKEQELANALIVVKFKDASRDVSYPVGAPQCAPGFQVAQIKT